MERIVCDQKILGGKPVIKGTRIAIYLVLDLLSEGYSIKDIIKLYPHITDEDIKACVKYASQLCQVGEIAEPFGAIGNA
jgi:uncharacterized protein (DUF433 family)